MVQPLGQFPVLQILGVAGWQQLGALAGTTVLFGIFTTFAIEQTPGVATGYGDQPCAQPTVLWQRVHVLDQDGERQLRNVGGVLAGEPVSSGHRKYKPLVSVQQALPRADVTLTAAPNQVSVV